MLEYDHDKHRARVIMYSRSLNVLFSCTLTIYFAVTTKPLQNPSGGLREGGLDVGVCVFGFFVFLSEMGWRCYDSETEAQNRQPG